MDTEKIDALNEATAHDRDGKKLGKVDRKSVV